MPFSKYKDFRSCLAANKGKRDPSAYCATIERKTKKNYSKGVVSLARKMSK